MKTKTTKRPVLVCVFAHPDDEAFGPGGTIAHYAKTHDVYILCATRGEAGGHGREKISDVREKELRSSARILGVKKVIFLDFTDGTLSNEIYHTLAGKIKKEIIPLRPDILMTFEPHGVSGHIDHIVVSMVTTYIFERFLPKVKTLLYFCHDTVQIASFTSFTKDYFIYFPPGYPKHMIGKTVDTTSVWETKREAMFTHVSQIDDAKMIFSIFEKLPKREYFLVLNK